MDYSLLMNVNSVGVRDDDILLRDKFARDRRPRIPFEGLTVLIRKLIHQTQLEASKFNHIKM